MPFELPSLPYPKDALAPFLSAETFDFHWGKHHAAYVTNLNKLVEGTDLAGKSLEELIKTAQGPVFNNAAQMWNHTFFWHCMSPDGGSSPKEALGEAIDRSFGSFTAFRDKFTASATGLFGSGWCWLARDASGALEILPLSNADTPLAHGKTPVLTVDVWEHAYYIDYRNARAKFVEGFWEVTNWDYAAKAFAG